MMRTSGNEIAPIDMYPLKVHQSELILLRARDYFISFQIKNSLT